MSRQPIEALRYLPCVPVTGRPSAARPIIFIISFLLASVCAWLVWSHIAGAQKRDIGLPPTDASPTTVVRTYLDALDARDCDTAAKLWTSDGNLDCHGIAGVSNIRVHDPVPGPQETTLQTYVTVEFHLSWRRFHYDPSLADDVAWGYYLDRSTPTSPWRITEGGAG
jgi:hypothetical protein